MIAPPSTPITCVRSCGARCGQACDSGHGTWEDTEWDGSGCHRIGLKPGDNGNSMGNWQDPRRLSSSLSGIAAGLTALGNGGRTLFLTACGKKITIQYMGARRQLTRQAIPRAAPETHLIMRWGDTV